MLALLLLMASLGAAGLNVEGTLPSGVQVRSLGGLDATGPVAVDRAGTRVALIEQGLRIQALDSGVRFPASEANPTQLGWSVDGSTLAAAFEGKGSCALRLYTVKGEPRGGCSIPGRICGLHWRRDGTLLALAVEMEPMRFGIRMAQVLHEWDGKGLPTASVLNENIMMPRVAQRVELMLPRLLGFELSPLEDEILYHRLYTPPALEPRLRLMLYHLGSGHTRVLATVGLAAHGARFSEAGDRILYGDGEVASHQVDPWGGRAEVTVPLPGRQVDQSPSGRLLFLDGQLFKDGRRLVQFLGPTRGFFGGEGGELFLVQGSHLYLMSGLPDGAVVPLREAELTRLRALRKWLSEGLITSEDYRQAAGEFHP